MAQMVDHDGKLAISFGRFVDMDRPQYREARSVSNIPSADYQYLIGYVIDFVSGSGNYGHIYRAGGNPVSVDCTGWQNVTVETPIAAPRNGREYGWVWGMGAWRKDYFPRCSECYHYHEPELPYCESCGHCHRPNPKLTYCPDCLKCHKTGKCAA